MKKSQVFGIMSFKGGVGKTISVINLACALKKLGKEIVIVDGNFLAPNLHFYLGLLSPETTLKEVIRKNMAVENAIYEHKSGIHIVPCNFYKGIDLRKFQKIINDLKEKYDYVIVDSGPSYTEEVIAILMVSDKLFFVTTPDYPTLASTVKAAKFARFKDVEIGGIILNRRRRKRYELGKKDVEKTTGLKVIAEIPEDVQVSKSLSKFSPVVWNYKRSKASKAYIRLAKEILEGK